MQYVPTRIRDVGWDQQGGVAPSAEGVRAVRGGEGVNAEDRAIFPELEDATKAYVTEDNQGFVYVTAV